MFYHIDEYNPNNVLISLLKLPMEQRLKALDLTTTPENVVEPVIKSDSRVHLLLQGLQSKDNDMLNVSF